MPNIFGPYRTRPPIMAVKVEDAMDIMIVRDTTRRAASLIGFPPADRAQLAGAAAALAELMLKTGEPQSIHLTGIVDGQKNGLQISAQAPWLAGIASSNVLVALRSKLGDLVDEVLLEGSDPPSVVMLMWIEEEAEDRSSAREDDL